VKYLEDPSYDSTFASTIYLKLLTRNYLGDDPIKVVSGKTDILTTPKK